MTDPADFSALWQISNNNFSRDGNNGANMSCIGIGASAGTIKRFEISGNGFYSVRATDTAITLDANCSEMHIGDNAYYGLTQPVNASTSTGEGITLFSSGAFGKFITAAKTTAAADQKFTVDYRGEIRGARLVAKPLVDETTAPWLSLVAIEDGTVAGTTVTLNEAFGIGREGATDSSSVAYWRTDVGAWTGSFLFMNPDTNPAGANGTQTFTGNYLKAVTGGLAGAAVFNIDYLPRLVMRAIAAPAWTGAGFGDIYYDVADAKWHVNDGAGNHAI